MFPSFLPLWHSGELTGRVDLLLRPPLNKSRGFWVSLHSPYPTIGPRARYARLLGRRTPTPRIETFQGRPPVFRSLVLSRTASARLRTALRERRKKYACGSTRKCFSGEPFARQPVHFSVVQCTANLFSHGVKNVEISTSPKPQTRNDFSSPASKARDFQIRCFVSTSILLAEKEKNFLDLAQILGPTLAWERSADAPDLA